MNFFHVCFVFAVKQHNACLILLETTVHTLPKYVFQVCLKYQADNFCSVPDLDTISVL